MATNYIRKFEIGGLHVESSINATNYIGDKNDVWTDDNDPTIWRIGDGVTPGGQLLISGLGSGITLSSLSVQQTAASGNGLLTYNSTNGVFTYTPPVVPTDVSDLTDTTNLLVHNTFDGDYNSLTNTPTIPADVSDLTDTTNLLTHTSLGNFSFSANTMTTINGDDGIDFFINGPTSDPTPAFINRKWRLADTGAIQFLDPFLNTVNVEITEAKVGQWDTSYGWGDHSTAGYQTIAGLNAAIDSHLNQSNPTSGYVLSWNGTDYAWVAQSGGSSYGDADVATYLNGNLDTSIIPDTNSTYDIGSAEFKIRHLYLSQNSLKFVDNSDIEYSMGVNSTGNKLEFNSETVATSSYQVNDTPAAIDITKRIHFIGHGLSYTLADGTYIGQELHFVYSDVGTGSSSIVVDNAKYTDAIDTTSARTAFSWILSNTAPGEKFEAIWDGTGWCLIGGEETV